MIQTEGMAANAGRDSLTRKARNEPDTRIHGRRNVYFAACAQHLSDRIIDTERATLVGNGAGTQNLKPDDGKIAGDGIAAKHLATLKMVRPCTRLEDVAERWAIA